MSKYLVRVPYLEGEDVNVDGTLKKYVTKGKPTVVMVQGNFCGYCTQAKPEFQKLARNKDITVVTIQVDGDDSDQKASNTLSNVVKWRGVPAYLGFNANGKFVKLHSGNRDASSLMQFSRML